MLGPVGEGEAHHSAIRVYRQWCLPPASRLAAGWAQEDRKGRASAAAPGSGSEEAGTHTEAMALAWNDSQVQDQDSHGTHSRGHLQALADIKERGRCDTLLASDLLIFPDTEEVTSSNLVPPTHFSTS
jgi:hypothetical protein